MDKCSGVVGATTVHIYVGDIFCIPPIQLKALVLIKVDSWIHIGKSRRQVSYTLPPEGALLGGNPGGWCVRWTNSFLPPRVFGVTLLSGAGKIVVDCTAKDPSAPNGCMMSVPQEGSATRLSAMRTQPFAGPLMPLGASYASIPPRNPEPWILNSLSGV